MTVGEFLEDYQYELCDKLTNVRNERQEKCKIIRDTIKNAGFVRGKKQDEYEDYIVYYSCKPTGHCMNIDEYKDDNFEIPFEVNVGFKDSHANFYDILYIKTSELSSFDFDAYTKKVVESVS